MPLDLPGKYKQGLILVIVVIKHSPTYIIPEEQLGSYTTHYLLGQMEERSITRQMPAMPEPSINGMWPTIISRCLGSAGPGRRLVRASTTIRVGNQLHDTSCIQLPDKNGRGCNVK